MKEKIIVIKDNDMKRDRDQYKEKIYNIMANLGAENDAMIKRKKDRLQFDYKVI